jgi:YVTN family beta-propeller protein
VTDVAAATVTFLFTDIEGSTRLLRELGDEYGAVLADHQRLLRESFARHGGREVDTQGDAFFVAFPRARDAVLAAVDAQRALAKYPWPDGAEVRVRMGIHTGGAALAEDRYVGIAVHRAARIAAAGHGGQILVSETTERLLEEEGLDGVALRDLGARRLKDIDRPVRLFQVQAPELRRDFPRLNTLDVARRRSRIRLAAGATVLLALAAVVAFVATRETQTVVPPNSLAVIDPGENRVETHVPVGVAPVAVAVGAGSVWVANAGDRTVTRINARTREVVRTIPVEATPTGIAVGAAGAVWVVHGLLGALSRIDPAYGQVRSIPNLAGRSSGGSVAAGGDEIWAAFADSTVVRVRPRGDPGFAGTAPAAIAVGEGAVWVANSGDNTVTRISPGTGSAVGIYQVGRRPSGIAVGAGSVWTANGLDGTVTRIDARSGSTTEVVRVGAGPAAIAYGAGAVWVANGDDGTVSRIDPATNEVSATIAVGNRPEAVAIGGDAVWVTVRTP